jgi:peptidoglycan/LPS O-acetylase OafA/YrhL
LSTTKYRPEIDGLRALAVLAVMIFHANDHWLNGGYLGVDVFFVISGYLITTIIISEIEQNKFSLINFYERRARRILPALYLVVIVSMPFAWLWLSPAYFKDFTNSIAAIGTFTSNFSFWFEEKYFGSTADLLPLLHSWSLAVEEQYYIIFPIFLMIFWSHGLKKILLIMSLVFIISLGVAHWASVFASHPRVISGSFYLLPTRGWELIVGSFVAFCIKYNQFPKSLGINRIVSLLGISMVLISFIIFDENISHPSIYTLLPTLGTGLIILSTTENTLAFRILTLPFLVKLGLISYSAYLWHYPMLVFSRHRLLDNVSDILSLLLLFLSIILAYISWKWVESPFRDKAKTSRKTIFSIFIFGLLAFQIIGFVSYQAYLKDEYSFRTNFDKTLMDSFKMARSDGCFNTPLNHLSDNWGCILGKQDDEIDFILFGDSHAEALSEVFNQVALDNDVSIFFTGANGCIPFLATHVQRSDQLNNNCYLLNQRLSKFARTKKVKGIFLSARWTYYTNSGYGGAQQFISKTDAGPFNLLDSRKAFEAGFNKTIDYFDDLNIPVYIFSQAPQQRFPAEMVYFHVYQDLNNINKLSVSRKSFEDLSNPYFSIMLKREKDLHLINMTDLFCNKDICPIGTYNQSYYSDADHLSVDGTMKIYKTISHLIQ